MKMCHTWKRVANLTKYGKLEKMLHTWENAAHLEICGTLGK